MTQNSNEHQSTKHSSRWKALPFHIIFSALLPVLTLMAGNIGEVQWEDIGLTSAITIGLTLLIFLLSWLLLRSHHQAGLLASLSITLFCSYGALLRLNDTLRDSTSIKFSSDVILITSIVVIVLTAIVLKYSKKEFKPLTHALNTILAVLLIYNVVMIQLNNSQSRQLTQNSKNPESINNLNKETIKGIGKSPDIYYLIFDAYVRDDILAEEFNFTNADFLAGLKERGFVIPEKSCSNYNRTFLSLASSLNMRLLNEFSKYDGEGNYGKYLELIENNQVAKTLKEQGYYFIHVGSWSKATKQNPLADKNVKPAVDDFLMNFLQTTMIKKYAKKHLYFESCARQVKAGIEQLKQAAKFKTSNEQPKYVFGHIISPHRPIYFDATGNLIKQESESTSTEEIRRRFVDQLKYLNTEITAIVDEILSHSPDAIIIIQGDHGTKLNRANQSMKKPWPKNYIRERAAILNAYKVPEKTQHRIYENITPVNSFSILFNDLFDSQFGIQPDTAYFIEPHKPYIFYDITNQADCNTLGH